MDDPTVVIVSPGGENSPGRTEASDGSPSESPSSEATAAVAAAAQQAVETGTQLGALQARVDALSAQVDALQATCAAGFGQQTRLLTELDAALQSVGEALEVIEEETTSTESSTQGATPVEVETPNPAIPAAPLRPVSRLRKLVLGG